METLRGTACKVACSHFDYPVMKSRPRKTVYFARFEIGGRKIRFESAQPLKSQAINEGDEMMVAGVVQNGTFAALAVRNFTTGVTSHQSFFFMFLGALLFSSAGTYILIQYFPDALRNGLAALAVIIMFAGIFFLFGGLLLYFGYRTLQAVNALRVAR